MDIQSQNNDLHHIINPLQSTVHKLHTEQQRIDGRIYNDNIDNINIDNIYRNTVIQSKPHTLTHSYGSSSVYMGNTYVICSIDIEITKQSELLRYTYEQRIQIELNCDRLCNYNKYRYNNIKNDNNTNSISQQLIYILQHSNCIDYTQLIIMLEQSDNIDATTSKQNKHNEQYTYILYCNIQCINDDGNLFDTCLLSIITALKNTYLPLYTQYNNILKQICISKQISNTSLKLNNIPVSTSIAILSDNSILIDPTYEEEKLSICNIYIVCNNNNNTISFNKIGYSSITDQQLQQCINIACKRQQYISQLLTK